MKMSSSAATVAFLVLALAVIAQAELSALTAEVRTQLETPENTVDDLVAEVQAKGPEFAKCSTELVQAKDKAFAEAHATVDACAIKAADALAKPPCTTDDADCLQSIDAFKVSTLADAGRCMLPAVRSVDGVVALLTADIVECDRRTSEHHVALPAVRRRSWWRRNRRRVWTAVGRVAISQIPFGR